MRRHGPWTVKNSTIPFSNQWVRLQVDDVTTPAGKPGTFTVVHYKPGVYIVPLDEDGNTHLIEQFAYALGKQSLEVVSGGIDGSERPLTAAKRELGEETGWRARKWTPLGMSQLATTNISSAQYVFLAQDLYPGRMRLDENEIIRVHKMPLEKAIENVMSGKILDAMSCVALLKTQYYLR